MAGLRVKVVIESGLFVEFGFGVGALGAVAECVGDLDKTLAAYHRAFAKALEFALTSDPATTATGSLPVTLHTAGLGGLRPSTLALLADFYDLLADLHCLAGLWGGAAAHAEAQLTCLRALYPRPSNRAAWLLEAVADALAGWAGVPRAVFVPRLPCSPSGTEWRTGPGVSGRHVRSSAVTRHPALLCKPVLPTVPMALAALAACAAAEGPAAAAPAAAAAAASGDPPSNEPMEAAGALVGRPPRAHRGAALARADPRGLHRGPPRAGPGLRLRGRRQR